MQFATTIDVTQAVDIGGDVLDVAGVLTLTKDDGTVVGKGALSARGHVSAATNYYPPEAYTEDPEKGLVRNEDAKPRSMTKDELTAYCVGLLVAQLSTMFVPVPAPSADLLSTL